MAETVVDLATKAGCLAIIPIGQCACFGGYPGCKPPISQATAGGFNPLMSQTGAMGVYDYLVAHGHSAEAGKVINVPGCPTNPWWFVLTVVMYLVDAVNRDRSGKSGHGPLGILKADLVDQRQLG